MNPRLLFVAILFIFCSGYSSAQVGFTVISPNGGEVLEAGTTTSIVYDLTSLSVTNVVVSYSDDGGDNFNVIETDTPTALTGNIVTWNIPAGVRSTDCLVLVKQGGFGTLGADTSDMLFTIYAPAPKVEIGIGGTICEGQSISFNVDTLYPDVTTYAWSTGGSGSSTTVMGSALGAGTHLVICTATDTTGTSTSDTASVTVKAAPKPSLPVDFGLCFGNSVVLDPGPGYLSYTWQDGSTSRFYTIDSTTHATGTYDFIISVDSANGCSGTDTVEITIEVCSGLDNLVGPQFKISPNPATEELYIEFGDSKSSSIEISLYTVSGALVNSWSRAGQQGGSQILYLSEQSAGLYLIQVKDESGVSSKSLIIE